MVILAKILVLIVALEHIGFLILEIALWEKPIGLKIFRMTKEKAKNSAALAANQGLYNGFLAAGLITSLFLNESEAFLFQVFFLSCVVVAGVFGAWTVSRRILYVQAIPAAVALLCVMVFLRPGFSLYIGL